MLNFISRRLTSDEINAMPLVCYAGPITVVKSQEQLKQALEVINLEPVIGFDTETRPTYKKGRCNRPALMQLAVSGHVYLIQLTLVSLSMGLLNVLTNPNQLKVGVGIAEDMRELARYTRFKAAGLVDLSLIAARHNIENLGLRPLAASFFGERISKSARCSNWALKDLSEKQIIYAATDAWIGRRLFLRMRELGLVEAI